MPFISGGSRKHRGELPIEEVELSCTVLADLLINRNRAGIKAFCDGFVARLVRQEIIWEFSSSHTKLGHSIKLTAHTVVDEKKWMVKRQTPYYSEDEYGPKETGHNMVRDLIHIIMSTMDELYKVVMYKNYDTIKDLEGAIFEIMKRDWV